MARPSNYTKAVGDAICEELAMGKSLRKVCLENDRFPDARTVFRWLRTNDEFCQQYARAKAESSNALVELMFDDHDNAIHDAQNIDPRAASAVVQAYKLKSDDTKWYLSKIQPKKYGDKLTHDSSETPLPIQILGGQAPAYVEEDVPETPQTQLR